MSRFVMQMNQINQFQREKSKNIDFSPSGPRDNNHTRARRVERKKLADP